MREHQKRTLKQGFDEYRASKTVLFWSSAGAAIVAVIVGFSWGGWVTGGSAREMAENSAAQARQELAALVCVDRFMATPDAAVQLTALKEITSSYARGNFVEEGGWAVMPVSSAAEPKSTVSTSTADRRAAALCADQLAKREVALPTTGDGATPISDKAPVAQ